MERITAIARALSEVGLDGWLFYDFRLSDPLAYRILGLSESGLSTRRWFYLIGADGNTQALVSAVEANRLDTLTASKRLIYRSEREMVAGLRAMLIGSRRIAMDYSPECAIPYVSRVDAGTLELVRATGVEIVSAADLIQLFEAALSTEQLAGHRRAAAALREIVHETFGEIAQFVKDRSLRTEYQIQRFVLERIAACGMHTDEAPIVAVNAHSANPHFTPRATHDTAIREGDLVLLDLFAKELLPDSIYGDLTWMGYVGASVPEEFEAVFTVVARARDAAVELIQSRIGQNCPVTGEEADRKARQVIESAGFADNFLHRTGHSIGREVHGTGANLDSLETRDHRALIEHTCFSVEPGIYLPGRFGIRSELDMYIENGRAEVSGGPSQSAIIPILTRYRS